MYRDPVVPVLAVLAAVPGLVLIMRRHLPVAVSCGRVYRRCRRPVTPLAAVARTAPVSGMNAAPSARPWLGSFGANPDGWFDPDRGAANAKSTVANMQRGCIGTGARIGSRPSRAPR